MVSAYISVFLRPLITAGLRVDHAFTTKFAFHHRSSVSDPPTLLLIMQESTTIDFTGFAFTDMRGTSGVTRGLLHSDG